MSTVDTRLGRRKVRTSSLLADLGTVLLVIFAVFPLLWFLYTSFRHESDIIQRATSLIPRGLTLANYVEAWGQADFPKLLLNSLIVSAATVLVSLSLATLAAYSLSRARFRGRGGLMGVYLAVRVVPGVLLLIPIYILMQQVHLLDSRIGLVLTYTTFTLPAAVWFMKGFFDSLPADLEDAARVDGCTRTGALVRVVLPLVRPGLAASGVLVAIEAWNDVLFALLLTSTTRSRTWPVGMKLLIGEFQLPWGQLAAATILTLVPVIIGFALAGRSMVSGLMTGGLKE